MNPLSIKTRAVDEYIASFPEEVQTKLEQLRIAIKKGAPEAEEVNSYQMPAYKYHGILVFLLFPSI